ncbi:MAG: redoxin domain-containing protein [Candidatus Omnitrophica bacterium]|nr:redoxin domain-containing protein [Candidatus Omnitrophota bacterium]
MFRCGFSRSGYLFSYKSFLASLAFLLIFSTFPHRVVAKPTINLVSLNGKLHSLYEFILHPYLVLMFWTSWCYFCKATLENINKNINRMYQRYIYSL